MIDEILKIIFTIENSDQKKMQEIKFTVENETRKILDSTLKHILNELKNLKIDGNKRKNN